MWFHRHKLPRVSGLTELVPETGVATGIVLRETGCAEVVKEASEIATGTPGRNCPRQTVQRRP